MKMGFELKPHNYDRKKITARYLQGTNSAFEERRKRYDSLKLFKL